MITFKPARILMLCSAVAAIATGCGTPPPPPPPVVAPPPPMIIPQPAPPPVALSARVIELASTYRAVMGAMAAITPNFTDGASVANAVRIGSTYEQEQMQQGAVAYAAIAALQEPTFVASVRQFAKDAPTRTDLARSILAEPYSASSLPNADRAAGLAIAALDGMGARVLVSGKAVKQSAYDVQRQSWSKASVSDGPGRLTNAKALSAQRLAAGIDDVAQLRQASVGAAAMSLSGDPVNAPYSDTITRGLALAALAALGHAGDENDGTLDPLLKTQDDSAFCLSMAKLNLYQCLAVSKPHYEDIFCLGQHSMIDTGQCAIKAAASPNPAFVEPTPPPVVHTAPAAKKPVAKKPAPKKK